MSHRTGSQRVEVRKDNSGPSRREVLRRSAIGASAGAAMWAAPSISGVGLAPAFAACASGGFEGVGSAGTNLTPAVISKTPGVHPGTLFCDGVAGAFVAVPVNDVVVTTNGSISGSTVTYAEICVEVDLCAIYAEQLRLAELASVSVGVVLADFSWDLTAMSIEVPYTDASGGGTILIPLPDTTLAGLAVPPGCLPVEGCTTMPIVATSPVAWQTGTFDGMVSVFADFVDQDGFGLNSCTVVAALDGAVTVSPVVDSDGQDVSAISC